MSFYEEQIPIVTKKGVELKAPVHRLSQLSSTTLSKSVKLPKKPKISREELRVLLVEREYDTNITKDEYKKDIYFDFPNPYNLVFTVYYDTAKGNAVHKEFDNPTKAYLFWLKTPMRRNSSPFISVGPQKSDSFPYNFSASGYPFQIALRYIEYLDKIEDWVKFLEESHPENLK